MFSMQIRPEVLAKLREQYPEGCTVVLERMCESIPRDARRHDRQGHPCGRRGRHPCGPGATGPHWPRFMASTAFAESTEHRHKRRS